MPGKLEFKWNEEANAQARAAIFKATVECFELDIVPEAKTLSPVTEQGLAHNEELGRKRPGGTGTNRRSIDSEVEDTDKGPIAELFTASGYGGYLEVGTSRMRAQPYLYPAFVKNIKKLYKRVREIIGEYK